MEEVGANENDPGPRKTLRPARTMDNSGWHVILICIVKICEFVADR